MASHERACLGAATLSCVVAVCCCCGFLVVKGGVVAAALVVATALYSLSVSSRAAPDTGAPWFMRC
jgi:hypothetical protein